MIALGDEICLRIYSLVVRKPERHLLRSLVERRREEALATTTALGNALRVLFIERTCIEVSAGGTES